MTSLEGATMIYSAGTTQDNIGMRETPTELVSVTQSLSPSINRVQSERPTEPVSEDTTIPISTPPLVGTSIQDLHKRVSILETGISTV